MDQGVASSCYGKNDNSTENDTKSNKVKYIFIYMIQIYNKYHDI